MNLLAISEMHRFSCRSELCGRRGGAVLVSSDPGIQRLAARRAGTAVTTAAVYAGQCVCHPHGDPALAADAIDTAIAGFRGTGKRRCGTVGATDICGCEDVASSQPCPCFPTSADAPEHIALRFQSFCLRGMVSCWLWKPIRYQVSCRRSHPPATSHCSLVFLFCNCRDRYGTRPVTRWSSRRESLPQRPCSERTRRLHRKKKKTTTTTTAATRRERKRGGGDTTGTPCYSTTVASELGVSCVI